MKKTILFFVRLALCGGVLFFISTEMAASAQSLSFPAEINKRFSPISIPAGGISRFIITIYNPNSFQLNNASWRDNLAGVQPGLSIANPANLTNSCGGTVTAVPGTAILTLSGGTVPAQVGVTPGECTVAIDVTSTTIGNLINTIPANALSSTGVLSSGETVPITNTTPASATLTVIGTVAPSVSKSFSPNTIFVGEVSVLTITINNTAPTLSLTQASLTDNLPENVVLADPPLPANALQNCGASASLVAIPGGNSVTLNNATVAPSPNCIVKVNVTSLRSGVYTNSIPANALTTQQGLTNISPATAPLNVQSVDIDKAFSPPSFQAGGTTTLTITLRNPTGTAYTGVHVSDTLPGTVLTMVPGSAATTCGGTVSITQPRTVTLIGGTIPAGSVTSPGTCTITVQVTAPAGATAGRFTNTIDAGTLGADQPGVTNLASSSARVQVYAAGTGISASKSFNPGTIDAGGNSRLRINVQAPPDTALTNFTITDTLPDGVTVSNSTSPNVSPGCGSSATLTAETLSDTITLSNADIEAGMLCRIDVWVTSSRLGTVTNTILPSGITNDQDRVPARALTADLTVLVSSDLSMSKAFSPNTVPANGISTLTITLQNMNTSPLVDVSVTDDLPGSGNTAVVVAPSANASTTCGSGVISATSGAQTIRMTGGTIPGQVGGVPGMCTISVDVQGSSTPGERSNTIPAANVTGTIESTGTTISPARSASATLDVQDIVIRLVKGFNPLTVFGGSASTMSVQLINPRGAEITGIGFTDTMPPGMFLATPVNFSVGDCGGTLSGDPGDDSFTFSGGSLPANSSCTLTLSVTTNVNGNLTNTIPAGAVTTANGITNPDPAEATLTNLAGASLSKYFSPNAIEPGGISLLTITIQNTGNIPLSGVGFRDTLLPGVTIAGPSAPGADNTCGGTLLADGGTQDIQLSDGVLEASSACTITVAVTGDTPGAYQNTISIGSLTNDQSTTNTQPATDTLTIGPSPVNEGGGGGNGGSGGGGEEGGGRTNRGGGGTETVSGGTVGLIPVTGFPASGFAPGRVTDLSRLPFTRYDALGDVTLEIPVLKLTLPIVGIPMNDSTWDVNWLLNQAGWLQGSAFPGFSGNSVLTSHVTLPYGQPGPFANLHKLRTGDKIFVHAFGELYDYEVVTVETLSATDPSIFRHEDNPWLTLVTCADYDEAAGTYLNRLTVRAKLVHIQLDKFWSNSP